MKRAWLAPAVVVLSATGARAQVVTSDPYLYGPGRNYVQTGAATRYVSGSSFFDVFVELDLGGTPVWGSDAGPIEGRPPVEAHGSVMVNGQAPLTWSVTSDMLIDTIPGSPGNFNIQVSELDLTGGTLPPLMEIRSSPNVPSVGQTQITDVGGGLYRIDSFFDIFTELSLDGGATWIPASNGPTHVQLTPAPGGAVVLGLGSLLAWSSRRRR
jgi:hypothetical protein